MQLKGLNTEQKEAVSIKDGPALVLAGAGTGKTRVITYRIANLIKEGVKPGHILAVTFTNKAAREMKERALSLLGKNRSKDTPIISTFHSLGVRILREEAKQADRRRDFSIYDRSDSVGILREILKELLTTDETPDAETLQVAVSAFKSGGSGKKPGDTFFARVVELYENILVSRNAFDFDDLICWPVKILGDSTLRKKYHDRYRYILVDEYQDTNQIQYEFLRLLVGPKKNIFVVGDDDQSIYMFRGAQREKILSFKKDYLGSKTVKLEQNYRSTNIILKAANAVIKRSPRRHPKTLYSHLGEGEKVRYFQYEDNYTETDGIVDEIREIMLFRRKKLEDIAILVRSIFQARPFEEKFRLRSIPYRLVGGRSWFDRKEIKDVLAYLKVLANPKDDTAFLRVVNFPKRGVGRKSISLLMAAAGKRKCGLCELLDYPEDLEGLQQNTRKKLQELADSFQHARKLVGEGNVGDAAWQLIKQIDYHKAVCSLYPDRETGEMRARSIDILLYSLQDFVKKNPGEGLAGYLGRFALDNELDRKDKDKQEGVTVMTLHSAKGLEFNTVYIPGVEEGMLPHEKSIEEGDQAVEEERRLFYVGMTRAKRSLTLSFCDSRRRRQEDAVVKPSRFFYDIPEELLECGDPSELDQPMTPEESANYLKLLRKKREERA